MEKFPDHVDAGSSNGSFLNTGTQPSATNGSFRSTSPKPHDHNTHTNGSAKHDRWMPLKKNEGSHSAMWSTSRGHRRQPSLGDAFRNIRTRRGSVSQNAHEIADALKAPVSPKLIVSSPSRVALQHEAYLSLLTGCPLQTKSSCMLIYSKVLCILWYTSSALTNTSSKSILNAFDKPATLTLVQFAFVSTLCITLAWLSTIFPFLREKIVELKHPIRKPSYEVIRQTLPLAAFQIGGHLLSSTATAKIPVSLVHTIKGLSPLFTVLAYRILFDIKYPNATYLSLIPLTFGVMLACSGKSQYGGQFLGVIEALLATLVFVAQNIFSKKLFNDADRAEAEAALGGKSKKLDKLNLLCYSSGFAFIVTMPIWFWSEGIYLIIDFLRDGSLDLTGKPGSMDHGRLIVEFAFNGVTHFAQNILAFVLLSMVSPVTYSVASLIKRVFVIILAILWFRNPTTPIQAVGIGLTFLGLYLYDRTSESNKADKKARTAGSSTTAAPLLPLNTANMNNTGNAALASAGAGFFQSPLSAGPRRDSQPYNTAFSHGANSDPKKTEDLPGRPRGASSAGWVPPGTRAEDTWRAGDQQAVH